MRYGSLRYLSMCACTNSVAMICKRFLFVCATLACFCYAEISAQTQIGTQRLKIPTTKFTCQGKASGYYADIDTGCQVYHMCDGLGRQFSYTCPNTTLFQQRMLICDHWYMVNCSMSERDYDANLLIGQRDKPFVSDEEMRLRTPRPDILSVPPNNNYYDGLREAETKYPIHPGNSIVGVADSISSANNNGLDSAKQKYRPPSSWSTGTNKHPTRPITNVNTNVNNLAGAASQTPRPTFEPTPSDDFKQNPLSNASPPSRELNPPFAPSTTEANSEEFDINIRMKDPAEDPVFKFIKRFDPNSPDSHKTAMSKSEIINLNKHLPPGQSSSEDDKGSKQANSEDERTPRKNKNIDNKLNTLNSDNDKSFSEGSRFDSVNTKSIPTVASEISNNVSVPERILLPPKREYSDLPSTTMGPPIYYEWKWAVPAFDLEPPKETNVTNITNTHQTRSIQGKSPFSSVTRPTPVTVDPTPSNVEYNTSSYFVPDYVFPLDKPHPGYENNDAQTSFQVDVSRPGRSSFGENPACPHCHPAYLKPGTCEPCMVKR